MLWSISRSFDFSLTSCMNSIASSSGWPLVLPLRVERGLEEIGVVHAGDLDRVLERHEHAFAGALVRIHVEQILALVGHLAARDLVLGMPGQRARKRALAGPVRAHDGVHFAGVHVQIDPLQDLFAFDADLQVLDFKHFLVLSRGPTPTTCQPSLSLGPLSIHNWRWNSFYPTDPSSDTLSSFCASTANSIGSSRNTSLQKPLTIMFTASSVVRPRWRQ